MNPEMGQLAAAAQFNDEQMEALAEEIVAQIKRRGPFLSLSEFVNRRLSTDQAVDSLSLAGTVEAALSQLSERTTDDNPYLDLLRIFS